MDANGSEQRLRREDEPLVSILSSIEQPSDLRSLDKQQLGKLAEEIRQTILATVAANGGHLAPNLGVVELTLALHRVLEAPRDKIVWDVGHQSYTHKLLTGRREAFATLRQFEGISGFPKTKESVYDEFGVGHSSTSISAALGLALARDFAKENYVVAAVIGDGALTGGMAFEALNHAGHVGANLLVVLNDNEMSISPNVGALSRYLTQLRLDPTLSRARSDVEQLIKRIPAIGGSMMKLADLMTDTIKTVLVPGRLFQELGFTYYGPIDGHDMSRMQQVLREATNRRGPVLVHVVTKKGKGWEPAEANPEKFHSVSPFCVDKALREYKAAARNLTAVSRSSRQLANDAEVYTGFSEVLGAGLVELAAADPQIVAITAAMPEGTGLSRFGKTYPDRLFDVGIAEEHAITLAAGLCKGGMRPIFAVYSTFLQRGIDQVIHDVCLQGLPVVFAVDRAGLVGEDGPTHHGVFDLSFLQTVPNLTILAPRSGLELVQMLTWAVHSPGPVAIRYPKDKLAKHVSLAQVKEEVARRQRVQGPQSPFAPTTIREGSDGVLFTVGTMVEAGVAAAQIVEETLGLTVQVVDLQTIKPLDYALIQGFAEGKQWMATLEENAIVNGVGSRIVQVLASEGKLPREVMNLGIPDEFVAHGDRAALLSALGLTGPAIAETVVQRLSGRRLLAPAGLTGASTGS